MKDVFISSIIILLLLAGEGRCFDYFFVYPSLIQQTSSKYRNTLVLQASSSSSKTNIIDTLNHNSIQVYDNVFSNFACEELSYLSEDHSRRGNDGSSIFTRPPNNEKPLTPLEHAIDSFLSTIGDLTMKVEYWSRDEYINIDTHSDIDEEQLLNENIIRCPKMGHVLYLEVEDELKGPTCVFPTKQYGWDSLQNQMIKDVELVTVPAVKGRVLRFPGNAMHAVPCPTTRWLLKSKDQQQLSHEENIKVDVCNDIEDFDDDFGERSVLLFNTWPDDEPGPRGVNGDYMNGSLPEGISLNEEDANSFFHSEQARVLAEWEEEYGTNAEKIRCNEKGDWNEVDIVNVQSIDTEEYKGLEIKLMGKESRRLHPNQFATLNGPHTFLENALRHDKQPFSFQLQEEEKAL